VIQIANTQSEIQRYLKMGIPVIWHSDGGLAKPNGGHHTEHCVLLTHFTPGSILYGLLDPAGGVKSEYNYHQLGGSDNSRAYAVLNDQAAAVIRSNKVSRGSTIHATAANQTINANYGKNLRLSATASSPLAIPLEELFITATMPGDKKIAVKMLKQSDGSYRGTIPGYLVTANFSYKIMAMNSYGARFYSDPVEVVVTGSSSAAGKFLDRASAGVSKLSTSVALTIDEAKRRLILNFRGIKQKTKQLFTRR